MAPEPTRHPAIVLEARDLSKRFGTLSALDGVSLAVNAGQVLAILGPSGSGKSTLLRCLNCLEIPEHGEIRFEGEVVPLRDKPLDRLRARVGMVFQQFNLFPHLNVLDNVTLALRVVGGAVKAEAEARARAHLARVGLADKTAAFPTQLSGGQQQRVAIARALAMEPAVLLFDEPTSALDSELTGEVLEVMRSLAAEGRTMVVVTHEIAFARAAAHEFVFMDSGRIVERGSPDQVIDAPTSERTARFFARYRG